mmetsp:Transcript_104197/g.290268  ORF Transcript_104197/g.290268 Transcript_104197/m.290268 type:complete len:197 (-) Transcript_104197:89-679(-)
MPPSEEHPLSEGALERRPSRRSFIPASVGQNVGGGKVRSDFSDVPLDFVLPDGDVEKGRRLFKKHCGQCHSVHPDNRIVQSGAFQLGPTLFNIYGRASGEEEIQQKQVMGGRVEGLVWFEGPLMNYMKNPRQMSQQNVQMNFRGIDDFQTRVDIIHYLKTLNWDNKEIANPPERPPSVIPIFPFNVIGHWWNKGKS